MNVLRCRFVLGVVLAAGMAVPCWARGVPLAKRHGEWLNGPASILITKVERETLLNLGTEQERDGLIEHFWEIRNPSPGSGQNEFKEEFYRRVAWADAHYGRYAGSDGWRTDMGRTYILFGRPQTSTSYLANQELHPIELWFYANPGGVTELPPFFYVLFFERDDISGYRFYHPYVDGPDKLLRAGGTKSQAYQYLRNISPELARASLTLIPGEPIDTDTFSGSMSSASVMNAIQGFRDLPSYLALVHSRSQRLERVRSRIDYDVARAALVTMVAREHGDPWLHWHLEIIDPLQPKAKSGRVEYEVSARLFSRGRLVFERSDTPGFAVPESAADSLKRRPFVYEDRIPLAPGDYRLEVSAVSRATGRSYEASRNITAAVPGDRPVLSDVVVVAGRERDDRTRPFSYSGVKFLPSAPAHTVSAKGLNLLYEVLAGEPRPATLDVEYVIGNLVTKFRKTFEERLDLRRADSFGALLTAKTLSLEELSPGAYQLAVRVKDPQTGKISARSVSFTVTAGEEDAPPIVISRHEAESAQQLAASRYERALCWLAQDRPSEAVANLEASWQLSHNPVTKGLLEHLYERTGQKSKALGF
jgi:GWxTD domain-containing protein